MRLGLAIVLSALAAGVVGFNLVTFAVAFARPPRPARLWEALLREILAGLLLLPVWPLWMVLGASYRRARSGQPHEHRPVVLLHGYAMNRTNWLWLGRRLARAGIGPLYGAGYFSLAPVAASAARLSRFVEELRAREGARKVDIVAHSLGGLVARYYLERLGGAPSVGRLITIATPHRGTRWGRWGWGRSARDLASGSPLLADLGPVRPGPVAYSSIWSTCDNLVLPADSARIGLEGDQAVDVVLEGLGHLSLLVSPRVADAVAARLAS